MTFQQVGPDVVETGSGTINLSALSAGGKENDDALVYPSISVTIGGAYGQDKFYGSISGPSSFGSGAEVNASSSSGDLIGVAANAAVILPHGYVSGAALSNTSTYTNETLAGLGLTTGVYTWTWGTGATADFFELDIGQSSTPEPSTFPVLALTVAGLMLGCSFRCVRVVKMNAACSSLSGRISPTEL
jgi:hypothetical protein